MPTIRLTTAQAIVRFLVAQRTLLDGQDAPLFAGCWAIFGHGNVAGMGEALFHARETLPTLRAHNEQAMALAAVAFAKARNRRQMMACTSSIGPGAMNMLTAAGVAHVIPAAGAAAARRRVRQPPAGPGAATGRGLGRRRRERQ